MNFRNALQLFDIDVENDVTLQPQLKIKIQLKLI